MQARHGWVLTHTTVGRHSAVYAFEFAYTPKHGSWLNVAEIELNVMNRQCLNQRIDSLKTVRDEVAARQAARDWLQTKVHWQFTNEEARINPPALYDIRSVTGH